MNYQNYNLIVACSKDFGIGINGKLPWNIPNDLKKFAKLTKGKGNNAIIMGRKTWDSLPIQPLPNRFNIVLTSNTELINKYQEYDNLIFLQSYKDIDNFCLSKSFDNVWIIGGASIYEYYLSCGFIKYIYLTYIDKLYDCDTFIKFIDNMEYPYQIIQLKEEKYNNINLFYITFIKLEKNKIVNFSYKSWKNKEFLGSGEIINWFPIGEKSNNYLIFIKNNKHQTPINDIITIPGNSITYIS